MWGNFVLGRGSFQGCTVTASLMLLYQHLFVYVHILTDTS